MKKYKVFLLLLRKSEYLINVLLVYELGLVELWIFEVVTKI